MTIAILFLGVYFAKSKQEQIIIEKVKQEIQQVINILKRKHLTDEIAGYIIKHIILPRIEYRIQNINLSQPQCDSLLAIYRKYFKHVVGAASTFFNAGLSMPLPYEIKEIDEIQEITQIATLSNCINNQSLLGRLTTIRMK